MSELKIARRLSVFTPVSARLILQSTEIYFLSLLGREGAEQQRSQTRVISFNFFITQRAFVRAILKPESHGAFRRRNVSAFKSADELHVAAVTHLLVVYGSIDIVQRDVAVNQQRDVARDGRISRQRLVLDQLRRTIEQRAEIQFQKIHRLAK